MKAKWFIILFMFFALLGCTNTTTTTTTTTTTRAPTTVTTEHEWIELTGTYYVVFFGGMPVVKSQSYLKLTIDSEGNFSGLLKITATNYSYVNSTRIDTWEYVASKEELLLTFVGGAPVVYEVVEYGTVLKFVDGDFIMLMEK